MKLRISLCIAIFFCGSVGFAQAYRFPHNKGQLEFTGAFTINQPIQVEGPGDFVKGRPALSGAIGLMHRFPLDHGFGIGVGGELSILPHSWVHLLEFSDLNGQEYSIYSPPFNEYFTGFTMSLPLSVSKRFTINQRNQLRLGVEGMVNLHPTTIDNGGYNTYSVMALNDSTSQTIMEGYLFPDSPPYSWSVRPSIGFERSTKGQSTLGLELLLHLSPHVLQEGYVGDLRDGDEARTYSLTHRINYIGLRFRYGFTYKPDQEREVTLGSEEEINKAKAEEKEIPPTKNWLVLSAALMELLEIVDDPYNYHNPDFHPNGRLSIGFERHDAFRWKISGGYFPLWTVAGLDEEFFGGSFFNGTDDVWELDVSIGMELFSTEKEGLKLIGWAGAGSMYLPSTRWARPDGSTASGSFQVWEYTGGPLVYQDTSTTYYNTTLNPYVQAALEVEWRFLRVMKMSLMPFYVQGFRKLYEQKITYQTPLLSNVNASVDSRGSHFGLSFQLKFPLDILRKKKEPAS